ncbi:MAG: glutaminase A, partial [Enterobacteriaceae bacterium]
VADYIPALAAYSKHNYGIALATVDGHLYQVGNSHSSFPIESISKIFTLSLVLEQIGREAVLQKLGANATGLPFNSSLAIDLHPCHPENPLVNAGAMSTVSLVKANNALQRWQEIIDNMQAFADDQLAVNEEVYHSESATNQRNQALAELMKADGWFYGPVKESVDLYTRQCSVNVTVLQLAKMGAVLANDGKSPFSHKQLLDKENVPSLLSEMVIEGLYNESGSWLYQVGVPAKSGVGGAILAVVPGRFAVAVYSPPLDQFGNSIRAQEAIRDIIQETNGSLFKAER